MKIHPIEEAINEQLRGFVPEDDLEYKAIKRNRRLTTQQIWRPKRRPETILIEMVDKMRNGNPNQAEPKKKRRKRRRGPKVRTVTYI